MEHPGARWTPFSQFILPFALLAPSHEEPRIQSEDVAGASALEKEEREKLARGLEADVLSWNDLAFGTCESGGEHYPGRPHPHMS